MNHLAERIIVTIDGPAASGKSSVARALAGRLGFGHVNTGSMYRAVTWMALEEGVSLEDSDRIVELLQNKVMEWKLCGDELAIFYRGRELNDELQGHAVNDCVSKIASLPTVRKVLVEAQRAFGTQQNIVMEGRDIGSVVFPDTPFKYYIDASVEERARRRAAQGLQDSIAQRDHLDASRSASPLVIAPDAEVIDSSNLQIEEVVDRIEQSLQQRGLLC